MHVPDEFLLDLRRLLRSDGMLDDVEVARRRWRVSRIDDKSIFGDDARRLANAFRSQRSCSFYVARVCDLLASAPVTAYRFDATEGDVERFQGPSYYDTNLDDCLLFNIPVSCVVFRPGVVDTTIFAGDAGFIREIDV
ncbi:hypothetical protein AKI39_14655 [Bordetella sp. H567]|nr:hypothetical protein AKI39_14655 [Bordetella sp. H567]